jgi:hypothetical protein
LWWLKFGNWGQVARAQHRSLGVLFPKNFRFVVGHGSHLFPSLFTDNRTSISLFFLVSDVKQPIFITISTMSQQIEALSLGDAPNTIVVKLHPTVVFSVLNNFVRRSDRETRVIGTLLGTVTNGCIEITECFGVPHMEKKDELFVAINKDYHKTMYNFHRRINRKEKIVGWYTTTSAEGALINDNSSLIHDFYSQECDHPVHIVVDTTLAGN